MGHDSWLSKHQERHVDLTTNPTFPIETIRGQYALRFDEMLDALLAAMNRHPHPVAALGDAALRRRLHGILDGTIAFALSPGPEHHLVTELGEALYGLCDGTRTALADIRLTLFDLLTDSLAGMYPPLRLAIDTALVHMSYGWILRDSRNGQPSPGPHMATLPAEWRDRVYLEAASQLPLGFFAIEVESGDLVMFNQGMTDLFGFTMEEELQLTPEDFRVEDSPEDDFDMVADMLAGRRKDIQRIGARPHKDGYPVWFDLYGWPIRDDNGEILFIAHLVTLADAAGTGGRPRGQADKRIRYLSRLSSDPIFIVGQDGDILYASPSVERSLGHDPGSLPGVRFDLFVVDEDQATTRSLMASVQASPRKSGKAEMRLKRIDGTAPWFEVVVSNLTDVEDVGGFTFQARDISERKELEQQLERLASADSLTGLFNRRGFLQALERALAQRDAAVSHLRLIYIDLDNFKEINDQFGHLAGDDVLMQIADRLRRIVGDAGIVGRIGGDEFVIVLQSESVLIMDGLVEKIQEALDSSCDYDGHEITVHGTMGMADAADASVLPRELLQLADIELYERKAERIRIDAGLKKR